MAELWWRTPFIPALGRQSRWVSEFEARLVYGGSSQDSQGYTEKPCLELPSPPPVKGSESFQRENQVVDLFQMSQMRVLSRYSMFASDLGG